MFYKQLYLICQQLNGNVQIIVISYNDVLVTRKRLVTSSSSLAQRKLSREQ